MSRATKLGLALVGAGTFLGLLGDGLLRETPLGLNAFLWIAAFAAIGIGLVRWQRAQLGRGRGALLVPFLVFGALLVWRDSPWLAALNLFAALVALSLVIATGAAFRVRVAGVTDYLTAALGAAWGGLAGAAWTLLDEISWAEIPRGSRAPQLAAAGRGFAIAVPLLVVFGGLFVAADAAFEELLRGLAPGDVEAPIVHALVIAGWAWLAIGLLRRLLRPEEEPAPFERERVRQPALGAVEVGIALALLDALFLAFVVVQLRYLFGGTGRVEAETGLTYAEYARRGFFELVVVAALVLPVLLLADWSLRRERPRHDWVFRALAGVLVALLFVVMASALERMRLYQRAYGLTELRVYATGFMLWLAVVFVWAAVTVLRGRRQLFAFGALVTGFAAVLAMNALNPDALIARTNVERARTGAEIDFRYLGGLSDDAVPALVAALPNLEPKLRARLAANLLARRPTGDWRTWNWSRSRAAALLEEKRVAPEALR